MKSSSIVSLILLSVLLFPSGFIAFTHGQQFTDQQPLEPTQKFATADWLSGWAYRKSHSINGAVGAGTNYQIQITVHYGSGTDSGADVYCNSNTQTDFDDIRFTDDDGSTLLDYWLEEYVVSDYAIFWVEVADNLDSFQSIYIYYGNSGATSLSDGDSTFIAWDDFDSDYTIGSIPKTSRGWEVIGMDGSDICEITTNPGGKSGNSLRLAEDGAGGSTLEVWNEWTEVSHDIEIHWDLFWANQDRYFTAMLVDRSDNAPSTLAYSYSTRNFDWSNDNGGWTDYQNGWGPSENTWHEIALAGSIAINGNSVCTMDGTSNTLLMQANGDVFDAIRFGQHADYYDDYYIDDFFITKMVVDGEPTHSTWSAEENIDWLVGWTYRKSHSITGATGAGTNYQIQITVRYGSGTDSWSDVYCNSHCQTDFADIRFVDDDGTTILDHWIEEYVASDYAIFWIEVADDLSSSQSIYIYYGNNEVSSTSSGDDTFIFFDDFNDGSIDAGKWHHSYDAGLDVESGGELHLTGGPGADALGMEMYGSKTEVGSNHAIESRIRFNEQPNTEFGWDERASDGTASGSAVDVANIYNRGDGKRYCTQDESGLTALTRISTITSYTNIGIYWFSDKVEYYQDGLIAKTIDTNIPVVNMGVHCYVYSAAAEIWLDWVAIRKCIELGPISSAWGLEEIFDAGTTSGTTTSTGTGPIPIGFDPLFTVMVGGSFAGIILVVVGVFLTRSRSRKKPLSSEETWIQPKRVQPPVVEKRQQQYVPPKQVYPSKAEQVKSEQSLRAILAAAATPRVIEKRIEPVIRKGPVHVASGFDVAGENLKLAVKIENTTEFIITGVQVVLDVPDGFEFIKGTDNSQSLGNIAGGGYQSAIFWLRPQRCVDGEYSGTIIYKDAKGQRQTIEIPAKRLVNVCPMLTSTESADEVFSRLKSGSLTRNCASFEFSGNPQSVLQMAEARLKGLVPVDRTENEFADGTYLGYSCYVGQTKYGENQFASEIQVSGTPSGGVLTLSIYSDDERILSGFFVDVMHDVRSHVEILKEKMCPIATCPKCGANIDLTKVDSNKIYQCEFCGAMGKVAPWMDSG